MSCTRAESTTTTKTTTNTNTTTTTTRSSRRRSSRRRRQCTMICATHTLHLLFSSSTTHLLLLLLLICTIAASSTCSASSGAQFTGVGGQQQQQQQIYGQPTPENHHKQHQHQHQNQEGRTGDNMLHDDHHHQVHKLMSEQDLRRTFQVDSHDQVPEYEILKLSVNSQEISDQRLLRHRRNSQQQQQQTQKQHQQLEARAPADSFRAFSPANANQEDAANEEADERRREEANRQQHQHHKPTSTEANEQQQETNLNEIVMKMSTFGKDFKLRLKRNVDFQKRIKDMKMFMAESTKDGRLRYTEMMEPSAASKEKRQKEDHSSASSPSLSLGGGGGGTLNGSGSPAAASAAGAAAATTSAAKGASGSDQSNVMFPHIDSTYHDEDNLAALLIHHDRKTGQLQVDGTIGNDFVIKPMPQATIDALLLKRQQQELLKKQQQQQQVATAAAAATAAAEQLAAASRLDRPAPASNNAVIAASASAAKAAASTTTDSLADLERKPKVAPGSSPLPANANSPAASSVANLERAIHMHDDDPHDDDEMFLDEDEAIEMAHLQSSASIESNQTGGAHLLAAGGGGRALPNQVNSPSNLSSFSASESQPFNSQQANSPLPQQLPQQHQRQQQVASRARLSPERKWKKYRKLMARTQVPKPGALATSASQQQQQQQQPVAQVAASSTAPSSSSALPERARRHTAQRQHHQQPHLDELEDELQVSHHIVYRQRPSSESSSEEHQHSFMVQPGEYARQSAASMERLAFSFAPQRLRQKRASADNMIDGSSSATGTGAEVAPAPEEADFAHDPLDGQFYLEPGDVTGFERAGYSDWSLISGQSTGGGRRALPPYALNATSTAYNQTSTDDQDDDDEMGLSSTGNSTLRGHQRRYKRHLSGGSGAAGRPHLQQQVRKKRQAPDTVWPEVLLVVDYDSFLLHGGDSRDVKRYFVSFWNGVDLRYKLLVHPHIRISLAGMIVAKDRDATPYLERNRLRAPNADAVDAAGALTDMGKYLYREDRLPTYDLAVVITKLDMCRRRYEGGRCNRGTAGFAYVGGACVVNKRLEKVNSVAIIEDSGGFSGIIVAAHEVGHLLGCVHDGSPPPSYLGGPGATHCPWEEGYIMSDLRHTERGFRWSQCSVEQFKHFLNGETATCLYNYPHESQMLHRLLPGTMLSLDEQCKRDRGTNACFKDARVCAQLFCFDSASGYCVSYRPAAEGSPCGEGQVCRNGKCVGEIENIIPDYTHQSQTVVARRPSAGGSHHSSRPLVDNGLSASSTSTATSTPKSKLPTISARMSSVEPTRTGYGFSQRWLKWQSTTPEQ